MRKLIDRLKTPARGIAKITFRIKVVTYFYIGIVIFLSNYSFDPSLAIGLLALYFTVPFLSHYTIKYFNNSIKVGINMGLLDTFMLGVSCGFLHYSFTVLSVFFAVGSANIIAFKGFRKLPHIMVVFTLGLMIPYFGFDFSMDISGSRFMNLSVLSLMLIYFSMFAFAAYKTSLGYKKLRNLFKSKNEEIIGSMQFAEKIQDSVLKRKEIQDKFDNTYFILYKPKEIVSGDFYWIYEKGDYIYVAVGDCTGHGVPGGLLTMLGTSFLNEILSAEEDWSPAKILDKLKKKMATEFHHEETIVRDGMDICLIKLNLKTNLLEYAGAYNPLYILRKQDRLQEKKEIREEDVKIEVIKADRLPIGHSFKNKTFTNHEIQMNSGDLVYLFTDGYADQFGGPKGKKMGYATFQRQLFTWSYLTVPQQKEQLEKFLNQWMSESNEEQLDDICVIGIRI